ncbi:MAG: phosphate/phosphite/phosphonate ABC transporter substrate-binding protein [Solirubrobacterales bacterium]|nr:phosphate/phosphite/phosphonate ABC transporter substrate-binding protein [Solirubrobacterales bacterium]MBV9472243.1 phosphate/phosphite/phosphonate ABC transporter substrate-binding protein [Solirubrobacterales bacterium]
MKKAAILLSLGAIALAGCGSSSSSKSTAGASQAAAKSAGCPHDPVRFAVEPYDAGPALESAYKSLTSALQTNLACPVQLIISNSYVAEIEAMRSGQLDLGEFGPLGYVLAHRIASAQPIAAFADPNGKPVTYTAGIWVKKSSPITSVAQLKGKTLALSSTTSTSGALYPVYALVQAGFKCQGVSSCQGITIKYAGGHPESLLALTHGTVDAAEVNSQQEATAEKAGKFNPADYREIWKSDPIENDPITVRGDLSPAFQQRVSAAILKLTPTQVASVDSELGTGSTGGMVSASDSLYSGITSLAQTEGLSLKNLG